MPDIQWKNIKTLHTYKNPKSETGYDLKIGQWVVDGREYEIILVKQEYKETVSGLKMNGKVKGLGTQDMYRIFDSAQLVSELMRFPLPKEFQQCLKK